MLEDVRRGKHPIIAGPMLVHQCLKFSTFNYFASTLIGYDKSICNVLAFGTDGDRNLTEAFGHNFPSISLFHTLQKKCPREASKYRYLTRWFQQVFR